MVSYRTKWPYGALGVRQDEWPYGALGVLQDEMALRGARCPTGRMALRGAQNFGGVPVESECVTNPDDSERNPIEPECVVKFFYEPG